MLRSALLFLILSMSFAGYAQDVVELSNNYTTDVTEKYHVLKHNNDIKQGLYQALFKKKTVIASGIYTEGKKTGVWHFYDNTGHVAQHYNYDKGRLLFVNDEDSTRNITRFEFVPKPAKNDLVTLPIRIGGILYGYLPYIKKFKVQDARSYNPNSLYAVMEILISPNGLLAECKLQVKTKQFVDGKLQETVVDSYLLNSELLTDDEKDFIPATVNHKPVSSTIYIYCRVQPNGRINIY